MRVDLRHEEGKQIGDELADLGEPVAPAISYDVDYVRCFAAGVSVSSFPKGSRADEEVKALTLFLMKQVLPRRDPLVGEPSAAVLWRTHET